MKGDLQITQIVNMSNLLSRPGLVDTLGHVRRDVMCPSLKAMSVGLAMTHVRRDLHPLLAVQRVGLCEELVLRRSK